MTEPTLQVITHVALPDGTPPGATVRLPVGEARQLLAVQAAHLPPADPDHDPPAPPPTPATRRRRPRSRPEPVTPTTED